MNNPFKLGDRVYVKHFEGLKNVSTTGTVIEPPKDLDWQVEPGHLVVKMDYYDDIQYKDNPKAYHSPRIEWCRKLTKLERALE